MFNLIYMGLLATESPCTFLDVKADRDCKTQIFLGNSPGYHLINLIYLIGCVILPINLKGLFGCRNFMVFMNGKPPCALHMVASLIWGFTSILLNSLMQIALVD